MIVLLIGLIFSLVGVSGLGLYFYLLSRDKQKDKKQLMPFDSTLVAWWAAAFALLICFVFFLLFDQDFIIDNNIGQVGDFVGGLTNPILSFIALLVLLRTTMIQTAEARKTADFLERQMRFIEREKFEGTFFQILERLEAYCEIHYRQADADTGITEGDKISRLISANSIAHSKLSPRAQYKAVKGVVSGVLNNDICIGFNNRAIRALRLINSADIPEPLKRSFSSLLTDSMYPSERKILAHYSFFYNRNARRLLREWRFPRLKEHAFASKLTFQYYDNGVKK
ncbi:hypothetical protein ABWL43_11595 [Pseudomonas sp. HT11]|uniref:hypothetical protein n=1 Tax=Pseudomonas sp. HT11 TaxID=3230490 RepID=UPI00384C1CE6